MMTGRGTLRGLMGPVRRWRGAGAIVVLAASPIACSDEGGTESAATTATTEAPAPTLTFYRPPTALDHGTPGELLERSGNIPLDPTWEGTGQRITYVSTTPAGDLVPVTGVVLVPNAPPPAGGYPILVWAHGTVGLGDPCAPSRVEPFQAV